MALPQEILSLHAVKMENLLDWLSSLEGPDLIDTHSDPPTMPYMCLAIGLDPYFIYQNPKGVVAGVGLIFKPHYISTMTFECASDIINNHVNGPDKCLVRPCLIFLSVSDRSNILPHSGVHPAFLDVVSKEKAEARPSGGSLTDFRYFKLPHVMAPCSKNSPEYVYCISYPHHPGVSPTLVNPLAS